MAESGIGFDREPEDEKPAREPEVEVDSGSEMPPKWGRDYKTEPQTLDQMVRHPESVRHGPVRVATFSLKENKDTVELNSLLAEAEPQEAPKIILHSQRIEFNQQGGHYVVLLTYNKVYYKHRDLANG